MFILRKIKISPSSPLVFLGLLFMTHIAQAQTGQLTSDNLSSAAIELAISPQRCVALRQGQVCYQEVEIRWKSTKAGDFCLVDKSNSRIMQCWSQAQQGRFYFDFQSSVSRQYAIRTVDSERDLAVSDITVAWVYKSPNRPKASWRLF